MRFVFVLNSFQFSIFILLIKFYPKCPPKPPSNPQPTSPSPQCRILTVAGRSANLCFIETDGTPPGPRTSRSAHHNRPTNLRPPQLFCLNATSKCSAKSRKPSRKLSKALSFEIQEDIHAGRSHSALDN